MRRYVDFKRLALVILVLAVAGAALGLYSRSGADSSTAARILRTYHGADRVEAAEGAFAPDFEATLLSGERVRLSDYRGKSVILNFWGTSCVACLAEIPAIDRLVMERAGQGLVALGVNVGDGRAQAEDAFHVHLGANYPSALDPGLVLARGFRLPGLPVSMFIDPEGRIEKLIVGQLSYPIFERYARVILGEKDVPGVNDPLPLRFFTSLPGVD